MPLLKLKNASYPEPDALALVNEYDLGRDGSKWRHGWQPLNAQAVAIKAKKPVGGGGSGKSVGDLKEARAQRASGLMMMKDHEVKAEARKAAVSTRGATTNALRARIMIAEEKSRRTQEAAKSVSGKSRLSTSTVRPSRLKLKGEGDHGRRSDATMRRIARTDEVQATRDAKVAGAKGREATPVTREFKTMAERRKEAAPRAFVNSGDVRLHATKDDGGSKIGTVSKYPSGGFRAQHKDDATAHAGSPFATRQEAVGALVLQHESRTPKTQAERVADIRAGKVQVYNVQTGEMEHVSPAEANAGHARYGQSLGAGTPAAGQTVKNALEAERARRAAAVAEAERTGHIGSASLDDLAKRRTTAELQRIASSMGTGTPEGRAARRELNTRGPVAAKKPMKAPAVKSTGHRLATSKEAEAARIAERDRDKPGFGAAANVTKTPAQLRADVRGLLATIERESDIVAKTSHRTAKANAQARLDRAKAQLAVARAKLRNAT